MHLKTEMHGSFSLDSMQGNALMKERCVADSLEADSIAKAKLLEMSESSKNHTGLIAQELKEVFPSAVELNKETGNYGIKYLELIPIIIKGMQEQNVIIESQAELINKQKKQLESFEKDIEELYAIIEKEGIKTKSKK